MLPSNSNHALHTHTHTHTHPHPPSTSPFQKPKAHYIQLEDLQEKNLEKKKQKLVKPTGTTSFYTHSIPGSKAGSGMFSANEFQSLHKAMIAATTHKHTPWPRGGSPTNLSPLGKSLEATRGKLNQQNQRENVQSGPQKPWTLEGRIAP
jgi:hypothetical protein